MIEAYWMKDEYPHTGDVICSNCKSRCDALREAHWGKNWKDLGTLGWKFHTYYQYCPHCGAKMEDEKVVDEVSKRLRRRTSMLKPAVLYKEQITKKFQERFYTDDMLYETGCNENWSPNIADCPDEGTFQFAIVDKADNCIGFIGFKVDWYSSCAYNFGIISFDKGNIVVGKALYEVMDMIMNEYKIYRIEWRMVGGNPVERSYDRFCKKYNGTKYVLHDVMRDKYGKYRDNVVYEILIKENKYTRELSRI